MVHGREKRFGKLGGIRQWVESFFDTLKGKLTLEDHGGRTIPSVYFRVTGRLLALAAGIWHNWLLGTPKKRCLTAYDQIFRGRETLNGAVFA